MSNPDRHLARGGVERSSPMILIVSAISEELGDVAGEVVGVGGVQAAVNMSRLLRASRPDGVIFLGTGGAYSGGPPVGSACLASRVGWSQGLAVMGLGYTPRPPAPIPCDRRLMGRSNLRTVGVLSVGSVTTDPTLAARLSDGWDVEQVEAYGIATACAAEGVPATMVIGITHVVGPSAHAQWLTNRETARNAARSALVEIIGG